MDDASDLRLAGNRRRRRDPRLTPVRAERGSLVDRTYQRLVDAITGGYLSIGQRLPSEPKLAGLLGVSRGTVREALGRLEQQGRLFRRVGDGTYVADLSQVFIEQLDVFESIDLIATGQKLTLTPINTVFESRPADERLARILSVSKGVLLHAVTRTLTCRLGPLVHMVDVVPDSVLTLDELKRGYVGVLRGQLIEAIPTAAFAEAEICTTPVPQKIAEILEVPVSAPQLVVEEIVYTRDEEAVEYSINYYNASRVRFRLIQRRTRR